MRHLIRLCLSFFAIFSLSSCSGFVPLYGNNSEYREELSRIEIEDNNSIKASEVYYHLSKLFGNNHSTKYLLKITNISDNTYPIAISGHSRLVKQNIANQYKYELLSKETGLLLDSGKIRIVGSYKAQENAYSSYTSERITSKNIARNVAQEIYARILLYFSTK